MVASHPRQCTAAWDPRVPITGTDYPQKVILRGHCCAAETAEGRIVSPRQKPEAPRFCLSGTAGNWRPTVDHLKRQVAPSTTTPV